MNMYGNIQVYVCSYLRVYDTTVMQDQMVIAYPIQTFFMGVGSILSM